MRLAIERKKWNRRVPGKILALFLEVTPQRVGQLFKQGIFERNTAGEYPLLDSVLSFQKWRARGGMTDEEFGQLSEQQTRLTAAKADMAEMKRDEEAGRLIDSKVVSSAWVDLLIPVRVGMLAVPSKMAPRLYGKSRSKIKDLLEEEVSQVLENLADAPIEYEISSPSEG